MFVWLRTSNYRSAVSLKHDGTDGPVKSVNTDGTAIERADGTANTGANYQIITY